MPEIEALAKLRQAYHAMSDTVLELHRELEELRANYQLSLAREKNTAEMAFKFLQERKEAMEYAAGMETQVTNLKQAARELLDDMRYVDKYHAEPIASNLAALIGIEQSSGYVFNKIENPENK